MSTFNVKSVAAIVGSDFRVTAVGGQGHISVGFVTEKLRELKDAEKFRVLAKAHEALKAKFPHLPEFDDVYRNGIPNNEKKPWTSWVHLHLPPPETSAVVVQQTDPLNERLKILIGGGMPAPQAYALVFGGSAPATAPSTETQSEPDPEIVDGDEIPV